MLAVVLSALSFVAFERQGLADSALCSTPEDFSRNFAYCMGEKSPGKNKKWQWREEIKGAYRSPLGPQVHPYCFEVTKTKGRSRKEAEDLAAKWIRNSFQVLMDCRQRYPELDPYLGELLAQTRQAVVTCTKKNYEEFGLAAVNPMVSIGPKFLVESEATVGIKELDSLDSLASAYKTVFILPRDRFEMVMAGKYDLEKTLVHEIAHSTEANNTGFRHNHVSEILGHLPKESCSEEGLDDRVSVIANLCTDYKEQYGGIKPARILYRRMNHCGSERGCKRLFTSVDSSIASLWARSKPLSEDQASQLCDRIHDQGYCEETLANVGEDAFLRSLPEFTEIEKRILEKVTAAIPRSNHLMPAAWLKAYPSVEQGLKAIGATDCYQSVFGERGDAGLALKVSAIHYFNDEERGLPTGGEAAQNKLLNSIEEAAAMSPYCKKSPSAAGAISELVRSLRKDLQEHRDAVRRTFPHLGERNRYDGIVAYSPGQAFEPIIGADLLQEYYDRLSRFHPKSPRFSCVNAGLAPRTAVRGIIKATANASSSEYIMMKCGTL